MIRVKNSPIEKTTNEKNFMRTLFLFLCMFVSVVAMGQVSIPTNPNSVLQNGVVYTVSANTTITATTAGQSGLQVAQGAKAVINIKAGVTLTVTGANADASKGFAGMPGILVPETSTLVVIGEGKLVAKGGNGSNGMNGENGEDAGGRPAGVTLDNANRRFTYTYSESFPNYGGYGGAGGDGGYGAGAGIGGAGGLGGKGGVRRERGAVSIQYSGLEGNAGGAATQSGGMGKVYILGNVDGSSTTLSVTSTAGNGGSVGAAGTNGYYGYTTSKVNNRYYSIGGGGAGAGGAAGGKPTYSIGAGGIAGAGGGSGGQGGADYSGTYQLTYGGFLGLGAMNQQNASCEGGSGEGGSRAANKQDSGNGKTTLWIWGSYTQKGGAGGAAGAAGTSGSQGNLYILGSSQSNAYKRVNNSTTSNKPASNTSWMTKNSLSSNTYKDIVSLYQISLSFDSQGGNTTPGAVQLIKGDAVTTSVATPTKTNYYFDGYYTDKEGGERIFDHSGKVVDATRTFTESTTLYAHWISNQFTVTWDYSYMDQSGRLQNLNTNDKSKYAKIQFNLGNALVATADTETNGTGTFANHRIAKATITAKVGSGTNNATNIYVTEDQLRTLQISAIALSSNNINATDNKYISTNNSSHEVVLSAIPTGTYMQPWSISITNEKKPDVLHVKLLRADSENGVYEVINQHTAAFACSNDGGVFSGSYPVWPQSALNKDLYYKVQIVGYEMDGIMHNVASMPLSSDISSYNSQKTITQPIGLPIVHLDLNSPNGKTPHYGSGTTEYIYASTYGETITISELKAELTDHRFEGWTATAQDDVTLTSITANGDISVYASWADAIPPVITFTGSKVDKGEEDADGYYDESLEVYVNITDANDKTDINQWYYITENQVDYEKIGNWISLDKTNDGNHTIIIKDQNFGLGYVYIKATDKDGNTSYSLSNQYKIDNQAPKITHTPNGRREDEYSVVCTDDNFQSIEVEVADNVGVTSVIVNGGTVDLTKTQDAEAIGVIGVSTKNGKIYLEKPGEYDRERDDDGNIIGPIPDFKTYSITARDAAGNTSTRLMTVYTKHEWETNADGSYMIQDGTEPTESEPGMLSHVNCTHCSRYILVNKDAQWIKVDTDNIQDMEQVQIKTGSVLVKDGDRIYHADPTINGAIDKAMSVYTNETNGIATIIKLTPNKVGAKVAEDESVTTLLVPSNDFPLILDLNGQSIDKNGVAYSEVTGNANVTILLNDGNNREIGPNPKAKDDIPYRNLSPVKGSPIKYVREFSSIQGGEGNPDNSEGVWQALYLPFNAERSSALTKVGTVDKVEITDTESKIWINKWTEGDGNTVLKAGEKYFIQHGVGTLELNSSDNELNGYSKDGGSQIDSYTIAGSLQSEDHESKSPRSFWVLTNGGYFLWAKVGQQQRPYRWVIYDDNASSGYAPSRDLTLYVIDPNINTDNIEEVDIETIEDAEIYNMSGQKMSKNVQLPRGIYISNGKKFYVK